MSGLAITLLGDARAELDGVELRVDTRKAIALLAWLAVTGREHRREALAALLWPDADDARARAALRRTLSTLSTALGGRWLSASRDRLWLDSTGVELDVTRFQQLLTVGGVGERAALHEAAIVYGGDFMAGFSLRDSPDFDDWQREQADRLRHQFGQVLDRLVTLASDAGDWSDALGHARRRLALDPLHEDAQRTLMKLYAWSGDRSAALRQYRECVRILDIELGVAPLEETTALYQAIQEQRLEPPTSPPATVTIESPPAPERHDRPGIYPLVGRSREVALIRDRWDSAGPDGHLITIEGEAGIGKTRLIETIVAGAASRGRRVLILRCFDGETGLAFGPIVDGLRSALADSTMAAALAGVPPDTARELARLVPLPRPQPDGPPAPLDTPGAQVRFFDAVVSGFQTVLDGDGPGLLIVDDAHWIDAASLELLGYLIRRLAGRPILLIINWRSEQVAADHPLRQIANGAIRAGTGTMLTLERLSEEEVRLLAEATARSLGVEPDSLGARLFDESEGVPFFAVEYLTELRLRALQPGGDAWPLPAGPRTLLLRRIASLSATESQILSALAAIGRTASYELLRDVSGRSDDEAISAIEGLLRQGIVTERVSDGAAAEPVYLIRHDKLREVTYEEISLTRRRLLHRRVAEALRSNDAPAAQVAHHLRLAGRDREAAGEYLTAGDAATALYATGDAISHYAAALALGHQDAAGLHERIGDLRTLRGDYDAALAAYETAAALLPATARIEHKLGRLYQRMGAWPRAAHHFATAEPLYQSEDSAERTHNLAQLSADWSLTALRMGDLDQAIAMGHTARRLADETGDAHALAMSDNLLGILARSNDDLLTARRHFEAALQLAIQIGEPGIQAAALNNLARVLQAGGERERAIALAREALALSVAHGDRHHEAALRSNLADLLHDAGSVDEAHQHLRASAALYAEIGVVAGEYQPEIWKLAEW